MRLPPVFTAAAALALVLTACGDDAGGGSAGACDRIRRERLDPDFLVHVLDDAGVEYTSDPPTSGPHQPSPPQTGVLDEPLTRPIQVGVLERGDVLLQYGPGLPQSELDDLEALADEHVVVAPNPDLEDPVVATAWLYKRTCASVDVPALQEFVAERQGKGPEGESTP